MPCTSIYLASDRSVRSSHCICGIQHLTRLPYSSNANPSHKRS
ncbi:hypothetical protein RSAG8_06665, partial [Rhizoctonia solani AG-8 WAC10335]